MATATELRTQLNAKRDEHAAFLTSFKTDDGGYDMPADEVGEFQKRNDELNELAQRYETAVGIEAAAVKNELARATEAKDAAPQDRLIKGVEEPEVKGRPAQTKEALDAHFEKGWKANAAALDRIAKGGQGAVEIPLGVGLKTVLQTSAHAPQADRQGTFPSALYFGDVEDVFPHGNTTSKSIDYYIQTTDTDNAASVPVAYAGILPDLFREGQGVVVEGKLLPGGLFEASSVLAKHDETYMPPEVAEALKDAGVWRHGEAAAGEAQCAPRSATTRWICGR